MAYACGEVTTKLNPHKKSFFVLDEETASKGCLRDLGYEKLTKGALGHDLGLYRMKLLPEFVRTKMIYDMMNDANAEMV